MAKSYYLFICSEYARLYERHENFFHVLEFQIALGATFRDSQLAPSKFNPWGASGQLLISNTALDDTTYQISRL